MSEFVFDKFGGGGYVGGAAIGLYWDFHRPGSRGEWWLSFHAIERRFQAWEGVSEAFNVVDAMVAALPEGEKARAMALAIKHRGDHGI